MHTRIFARLAAASLLAAGWCSPAASAQASGSGVYGNLGALYAGADTRPDGHFGGIARIGSRLGRTGAGRALAVEAEAGLGFGSRSEESGGESGDVFREAELDALLGVFAVARLPLGTDGSGPPGGSLFARVGVGSHGYTNTRTEILPDRTVEVRDRVADRNVSGLALGIGGEVFFGPSRRHGLRVDATSVLDGTDELSLGGLFGIDGSGYVSVAYVGRF